MTPELSRPQAIDSVGPAGVDVLVEASAAECAALARRMQLPAIHALTCRFHLERGFGSTIVVQGQLHASVVQTCVISLDDFVAEVDEAFLLHAVPEGEESDDLDPEVPDEISYEHGIVDLGEAASQQLALALDPYPRAPGAVLPETEDGTEPNPFAALAALKRRH